MLSYLILTVFLVTLSSLSQAQIAKFIGGPQSVCVNQPVNYDSGPALCVESYWRVKHNGVTVLDYGALDTRCAPYARPYTTYLNNVIDIRVTPSICALSGRTYFYMYNNLPITFKLPGTYTIEAIPKGRVEGIGSGCNNAQITVQVGPQTIGSTISGATAVECNFGGTKIYSVPANPSATFTWSADAALNAAMQSQSGNTATIKFNSTSNTNASGYVRVTVTDCGVSTTRTLLVKRTAPPSGMNGPYNICVGSYGSFQAVDFSGTNYSWSVSPTSIFSINPNGSNASVNAFGEGSGVVILNYNRPCDNLYMTERRGIYASNCGYSMAADTTTTTLMVSPNPATDETQVSYSETTTDYPVKIRNSFNKVVAAGTLRNGKFRVNTRHLPAGIYIVTLEDKERGVISVRMVKN
ncbi:T9SS type A sorting domain-containing protein [Rhodocytophaga aerolata]|uniref:T9SS type A sorting domain-containing protein n=1 Tax=Rhodocytophaga aerolata TaxID=455078 RepID=A0ABT8RJ04_9BACT|nr:T9SS type A sorting domain-containing protein [Rhodocytophaga aerolata]MDO1451359.1 T9SS type A sorting domain-containing protein [Rhodocytophaga aerolata]